MVDSVQNNGTNNTALYTALGAGVGAVGGGAYGKFMTKPYLKDDAPSDAFIRTAHDTLGDAVANEAADTAKKAAEAALKDKDFAALKAELSDVEKAASYGLAEVKAADGTVTKSLDDVVTEYIGSETDKTKLANKMADSAAATAKKAVQDRHVSGVKLGDAIDEFGKFTAETKPEDIKAAVKKHAEALGVNADDDKKIAETAAEGLENIKSTLSKKLEATKTKVESFLDGGKLKAEANIAEGDKSAFKAVKEAMGKLTNKAALKWGAIAAGVLALIGLGAGIATKKAPAAPEEQHVSTQA